MESKKTKPLEVFPFAQEMEQMEEEKHHKKPVFMVKAVTKVTNSTEDEESMEINLESWTMRSSA